MNEFMVCLNYMDMGPSLTKHKYPLQDGFQDKGTVLQANKGQ